MALSILPVIGSSGFYSLMPPFDAEVVAKVEYTCQAIRKISDYIASNEDVKEDVYTAYNLPPEAWEEDSQADAYVVSLQSRTGHWLYVPSRYILSYPSVDGVRYCSVMLGISVPALPVSQDLSAVLIELKSMTEHALGVTVAARQVETSKVILVEHDTHIAKQQARTQASQGLTNTYARNVKLISENTALQAKVAELEAYIKQHYVK